MAYSQPEGGFSKRKRPLQYAVGDCCTNTTKKTNKDEPADPDWKYSSA